VPIVSAHFRSLSERCARHFRPIRDVHITCVQSQNCTSFLSNQRDVYVTCVQSETCAHHFRPIGEMCTSCKSNQRFACHFRPIREMCTSVTCIQSDIRSVSNSPQRRPAKQHLVCHAGPAAVSHRWHSDDDGHSSTGPAAPPAGRPLKFHETGRSVCSRSDSTPRHRPDRTVRLPALTRDWSRLPRIYTTTCSVLFIRGRW